MPSQTQAAMEVARFLARRPPPEQIITFRLSPEVVEHAYALVAGERAGALIPSETAELDSIENLEHLMRLIKAEAHLQLQQQAS